MKNPSIRRAIYSRRSHPAEGWLLGSATLLFAPSVIRDAMKNPNIQRAIYSRRNHPAKGWRLRIAPRLCAPSVFRDAMKHRRIRRAIYSRTNHAAKGWRLGEACGWVEWVVLAKLLGSVLKEGVEGGARSGGRPY